MGRIRYGLSNLYYATITTASGVEKYGTPVKLPGAVSMSLDAQGEETNVHADNGIWFTHVSNNGYSGSLEFQDTADADTFLQTVMGWAKDETSGIVTESVTDKPVEFALLGQFELAGGTETGKRFCMYRCVASRPSVAGDTKEDSIAASTNNINLTCLGRLSDGKCKASADSTANAYSAWFTAVPDITA